MTDETNTDNAAPEGGADVTNTDGNDEVNTSPEADGSSDGKDDESTPEGKDDAVDDSTSPETYSDFTLPEGVELDVSMMDKATPLFKELGLNQDQAQKLVDLQMGAVQESQRVQGESFSQLIEQWQTDASNDSEYGGDDFEKNVGIARKSMEAFGTPEFKQLMEDHGVGNHPEMIRFMWNVGKTLQEDVPTNLGGNSTEGKDRVSRMYKS